jgi:hypothetical protein
MGSGCNCLFDRSLLLLYYNRRLKMSKKRKLNSKNPKYKKDNEEKLVVLKKVPFTGKAPGYGVWYKIQNNE